ncbi:MAG: hypothetical protein FWD68_05615 [Alphaproteobacteria bacterium]|nr:hypothetical protein [Alphaproteobacteria bacterium]
MDRAHAQAWGDYFQPQTPSRIFAQNCRNCHESPRGLVRTVSPGYLPQFLREHYTAWEMADRVAAYLLASNRKPRAVNRAAAGSEGHARKGEPSTSKRRQAAPGSAKPASAKPADTAKPEDATLTPETRRAKEESERGKQEENSRTATTPTPEPEAGADQSEHPAAAQSPATESPATESPATESPASDGAKEPASEPAGESR